MKRNANKLEKNITILLFIIIIIVGIYFNYEKENQTDTTVSHNNISYEISNIPEHKEEELVEINNNIPKFTTKDMNLEEDYYSNLENKKVRNGYDKN